MGANGSGTIVSAEGIEQKLVDIRRHLHQYPELSHEEFETTAYIRRRLEEEEIRIATQFDLKTGLIAEVGGLHGVFRGLRNGSRSMPEPPWNWLCQATGGVPLPRRERGGKRRSRSGGCHVGT